MSLQVGTRLGVFEILDPLGAGGMGEVYRARDTKLDREVAVKLLPEQLGADADRLARFRREAQLLASLNHPNIAAIYELGDAGGKPFLVLELVEGATLAERIESAAIPVDEALDIARQIAEALEEAHEHGIVHRDLKPANVKLSASGRVKVLDFGLAKAFADDGGEDSSSGLSQSPTIARQATEAGVILGTAAYMSPEQARGNPVDKRADIWAFGVVLFEMLTGRRLFDGDTVSDTLAAVLRAPIETAGLPGDATRRVRHLLERCLVRDPTMRLRDIGEARILLSSPAEPSDETVPERGPRSARTSVAVPWGVAVLAAIVAAFGFWNDPTSEQNPTMPLRFTIDARNVGGASVSVSPDGRHLAFRQALFSNFQGSLWVRPLDRLDTIEIPDTANLVDYFWSADGREVAFAREGKLFAHDIETGTTRQLLSGEGPFWGGSWSDRGVLLLGMAQSIYRASASGGTPEVLLAPEEGKTAWHAWPSFLPDGERFLFTSQIEEAGNNLPIVQVAELGAPSQARILIRGAMSARWSSGHIVYATDSGVLTAQRADPDSLELIGAPFVLGQGTLSDSRIGFVGAGASANGIVAYRTARFSETEFVWFSPTGQRLSKASEPGTWHNFELSPDGQRIAATARVVGSPNELWVIEARRGITSRIVEPGSLSVSDPTWSPDGQRLAFRFDRSLVTRAVQGGEIETVLNERAYPDSWSRDGKWLLYGNASLGRYDLFAIAMDQADAEPVRLVDGSPSADEPRFSPDGSWVAYHANTTTSTSEIFAIPFPPTGERWQLSGGGGVQPRWSADGDTLFYLDPGGRLMRVPIPKSDPRGAGAPEAVFETGLEVSTSYDDYTVAPDGRFLLRVPTRGTPAGAPIHVLVGWEKLAR